jgi:predicted MFS family arabinose efflux permease
MTAAGLGATLGVLVIAGWLARRPSRTGLASVLCAHGLLFLPLFVCRILPLAMVLAFLVYFAGMSFYTLERTILQRAVPVQTRGQVLGARRAFTAGGYPLGAAIAGPLVSQLGAPLVFAALGIGMCVLAAAVWLGAAFKEGSNGQVIAPPIVSSVDGDGEVADADKMNHQETA